jgi:membrane-bound ClpP family serine protease
MSKDWWKSKLFWQNIFLVLMGSLLLAADYFQPSVIVTASGILTFLAGVCGIVIRVFFTNTGINNPFQK